MRHATFTEVPMRLSDYKVSELKEEIEKACQNLIFVSKKELIHLGIAEIKRIVELMDELYLRVYEEDIDAGRLDRHPMKW
jgi:hypothetical protein